MDRKTLAIGILIGFVVGTVLTGAIIAYYAIEIVDHIPTGLVQNMNVTVTMNETRVIEEMNNTGIFDRMAENARGE